MKRIIGCLLAIAAAAPVESAFAQPADRQIRGPVCLTIDGARDTFSPEERRAALILVARQFDLAGVEVVTSGCTVRFFLSHVRLGQTITVTLEGPASQREGKATGLDDLDGLYSQLVRAILTGSSVGVMDVVDRTNVTWPQAEPKRVGIDSFGYARLGYGRMLGDSGSGNPVMGFGYRAEMDSFGLDVSFLNTHVSSYDFGYGSSGGTATSMIKLQALYFLNPRANASLYVGGGLSWGATSGSAEVPTLANSPSSYSSWSGSGLQGELTAGYELPRASELRLFIQADATLPFYYTKGQTYTYSGGRSIKASLGRRYNPSAAVSVGVGWQRHRR